MCSAIKHTVILPSLSKAGDVVFWRGKRSEADIRHPSQYHSPLATERRKSLPLLILLILSYLPSMLRIHISSSSKK